MSEPAAVDRKLAKRLMLDELFDFFDLHVERLDLARRLKLRLLVFVCRLFGAPAIHLVLEAIEVYGVRKYLRAKVSPSWSLVSY